jgi:hypothetical protein
MQDRTCRSQAKPWEHGRDQHDPVPESADMDRPDDEDLRAFDRDGVVTLAGPFTAEAIAAAAAAVAGLMPRVVDEQRRVRTNDFHDPALTALVEHPWIERAARLALRAQAIEVVENAIVRVHPTPGADFSFWEHVDARYPLAALEATPRRIGLAVIVWLTDVDAATAPMMVRPGSHRQLGAWWDAHPGPVLRGGTPAELPALGFAEARPLLARAGQVSLCITAALHGGSVATGTRDRRSLHLGVVPAGLDLGFADTPERRAYFAALRAELRPERAHLVPA